MRLRQWILVTGLIFSPLTLARLPEINEAESATCRPLGEVTASSGYGKNPNWQAIARTYAEKKAEGLGATHLGPIQYKPGGSFNGEVKTKAYSCP
jgi:hypothetical protein